MHGWCGLEKNQGRRKDWHTMWLTGSKSPPITARPPLRRNVIHSTSGVFWRQLLAFGHELMKETRVIHNRHTWHELDQPPWVLTLSSKSCCSTRSKMNVSHLPNTTFHTKYFARRVSIFRVMPSFKVLTSVRTVMRTTS